ncbi:MAG: segregation/condensation protein A [Candidatus Aenigmarchaeota archaeon]|nr:segregation/condensation protein A [Candidatus Aenigmarchaeota archaeon]
MTEEQNILKMIIEKENWEEIIYYIVNVQNIDPWNVDLVKLSDSFLKFIKATEDIDFRIPAKIVFVAAILLRLKADYLSIFEEKEDDIDEMLKEQKPFEELGIDPKLIQLGYPMKRIPKRQITLEELMGALKKAMVVEKKKTERRQLWQDKLQTAVAVEEEDITVRIDKLMKNIDELMEKLNKDKLGFREIVKDWKKDKVVSNLIPLLHLEQSQKITTEQEEFFKEIFIRKKYKM